MKANPWPAGAAPMTHGYWCACDICRDAYTMYYRMPWGGVPPDVAADGYFTRGLRNVPAGTVTRNTPRK